MITIPAASLAGAQIVQAGGANTNTTNSGQGTVTVTLPVSGNMVNAGGMVMVRPCAEVLSILLPYFYLDSHQGVWCGGGHRTFKCLLNLGSIYQFIALVLTTTSLHYETVEIKCVNRFILLL